MTEPTRVSVLGPTEVSASERPTALRTARQKRLVAALALGGGFAVSSDRLAEAIWGGALPADPAAALHSQVSRLRAALGPSTVATVPGGYRLGADVVVDAAEFEQALAEARAAADLAERAERLRAAVALCRGRAYEDLDTDDARTEAVRLHELRLAASEDLAGLLLEVGPANEAIALAEALCHSEPLRERARVTAATGLALTGRDGEALRLLDDFRRTLATQLGIEPSDEVAQLQRTILAKQLDRSAAAEALTPVGRMTTPPFLTVPVFGRDNDAVAVAHLLSESRLVTLVGPGGVGKTTLALAVARRPEIERRPGCAYVDLARVGAADDVPAVFAAALGIERDTHGSWADRLAEAIGRRELLVIVDNAEHLLDATAALVMDLLRHTEGIAFLVTSREALSLPGERLWTVEPLAVTPDQAIALFCDRATAARSDWTLSNEALPAVVDICQRLDGLPLAIELAASEIRARTVHEIAGQIDHPLALLEHGSRSEARHRTLRAVIASSHELLDRDQRAVFERLSVFMGAFSMDDARRICADIAEATEAERIVVGLVDRSLVRYQPGIYGSRYRMLDTIRAYASDRLDAAHGSEVARDCHAAMVITSISRAIEVMWGPDEASAVAWFDESHGEIVGAYRWLQQRDAIDDALHLAAQAHLFGWAHGRSTLRELACAAVAAIEGSESTTGSPSHSLLALTYGAAAAAAHTAGAAEEAERLVRAGFDHAHRAGKADARLCHGVAADLALFAGDTAAAVEHYQAAAEGFRSARIPAMAAYLDAAAGLALTYGGRIDEARPILERSLAATDDSGCPSARAFARYALAELAVGDDSSRAQQLLDEAIGLAQSVNATFVAGIAELSLATLLARIGDPTATLPHYSRLISLWRLAGNWTQQWNTLRTLVFVLIDLGSHRAACELMAAIATHGAQPTWGRDASAWDAARDAVHSHLDRSEIEVAEAAAKSMERGNVVTAAETHVAEATRVTPRTK